VSKKKQDKRKIDTSGGEPLANQALAGLSFSGPLATTPDSIHRAEDSPKKQKVKGGRLDVKREKSGRAGKTVTVIYAFPGMDSNMKKEILKLLKTRLATGGSITNGNIEVQGDFPEKVVEILNGSGYRAVKAGG